MTDENREFYRELFIAKHKSKEGEISLRSSSYGSSSERVTFGLSLASSSSELMNARMISLESSSSPGLVVSLSYSFIRFNAVSACPVVILGQCPGISQCWLASSERTLLLQA